MYAITGITGQVGGAVARTLLAEGANVKAAPWVEHGCELAIAEMSEAPVVTWVGRNRNGGFRAPTAMSLSLFLADALDLAETIDDVLQERSIVAKSPRLHAGDLACFVP